MRRADRHAWDATLIAELMLSPLDYAYFRRRWAYFTRHLRWANRGRHSRRHETPRLISRVSLDKLRLSHFFILVFLPLHAIAIYLPAAGFTPAWEFCDIWAAELLPPRGRWGSWCCRHCHSWGLAFMVLHAAADITLRYHCMRCRYAVRRPTAAALNIEPVSRQLRHDIALQIVAFYPIYIYHCHYFYLLMPLIRFIDISSLRSFTHWRFSSQIAYAFFTYFLAADAAVRLEADIACRPFRRFRRFLHISRVIAELARCDRSRRPDAITPSWCYF